MRKLAIPLSALILCATLETGVEGHRETQDAIYLDRRISMLETRLNTIESSVRTLEQQAMMSRSTASQTARDPEVALLRSEVEILLGRIRELDCGLARLDERTLSGSAKEARKRTQQAQDPCRLNPEAPLQLSPRR
ncbi:MAG TPA: hypothetical protein VKF81_03120 [Blastocatellia bacterium]|nr:hypothetical protein [Blastocatellia bacterium]